MNNFDFLESIDKNLFDIITEAERLYRNEFFEQCITQTRRFGECVCKKILYPAPVCETNFDNMLATLKDQAIHSEQEKEFVDDLYFLKREGNTSVHSDTVKKDGIVALECLQRSFEIAINFCVYHKKSDSNLLKMQYDTEMLVTGKKSKTTLTEKYLKEKSNQRKPKKEKTTIKQPRKNDSAQSHTIQTKIPQNITFPWLFVFIACAISILFAIIIYLFTL